MHKALRLKLAEWTQEYQQYLEGAPTLDVCSCSWTLADPDAGENSRRVRSHVNLECPVHTREGRVLGFLLWAEKTKGLRFYTLQEQIDAIMSETGESEEIARTMVEAHDACVSEAELEEQAEENEHWDAVAQQFREVFKDYPKFVDAVLGQPKGIKLDVSNVEIPPEEIERLKEKLKNLPQGTLILDGKLWDGSDEPRFTEVVHGGFRPLCPTTLRVIPDVAAVSITGELLQWRCCGGAYEQGAGDHVVPEDGWVEESRRNGVYRS